MREIKFRAWDADEKEMVDWWYLLRDPDDWFDGLVSGSADPNDALMQYTGLKDKKGVEIYEGDIVENGDYEGDAHAWNLWKEVVTWNEGDWGFSGLYENERGVSQCEVIGNIYENPELLISDDVIKAADDWLINGKYNDRGR